MSGLEEAILQLREEAMKLGGEVKSISLTEKACVFPIEQYTSPNVIPTKLKIFGVEIIKVEERTV